ncbi:MAG TPA: glycosyltransferase, partial [Ilumatobacteraceae bacterium]|nr:glycosyltransferase [Ilumatobacteraceae bacterium]
MTAPVNARVNVPIKVFVAATGNAFMRDIAAAFVEAAQQLGRDAQLVDDRLPDADGSINFVVAPHEFYVLADADPAALKRAAAASIAICTEQPATPWFHLSLDACQRGLLAFDINEHGTTALREYGVRAERLPFGAVPSMVAPGAHRADRPVAERPIDVLFMGSLDPTRGAALAGLAPVLWNRHADLRLFPFDKPVRPDSPGVVFGAAKFDVLRSAKVLVNVHRDRSTHLPTGAEPPAYFEWVRMVEAMANGCVVVTEPSEGFAPLVPGEYFVEATAAGMPAVIDDLLADPDRMQHIADAARRAVTEQLPLH